MTNPKQDVQVAEDLRDEYALTLCSPSGDIFNAGFVRELIERTSAAESEVQRLREENAALEEWKRSVSSAIKGIPEFTSGKWGGDKEGWGFHFEIVNWLRRECTALRKQVEAHEKPVSDEEWKSYCDSRNYDPSVTSRTAFDELIAARKLDAKE